MKKQIYYSSKVGKELGFEGELQKPTKLYGTSPKINLELMKSYADLTMVNVNNILTAYPHNGSIADAAKLCQIAGGYIDNGLRLMGELGETSYFKAADEAELINAVHTFNYILNNAGSANKINRAIASDTSLKCKMHLYLDIPDGVNEGCCNMYTYSTNKLVNVTDFHHISRNVAITVIKAYKDNISLGIVEISPHYLVDNNHNRTDHMEVYIKFGKANATQEPKLFSSRRVFNLSNKIDKMFNEAFDEGKE